MEERLQKILARAGIGSRRKSEEFIKQGKVAVDGRIITELGFKVDPQRHSISFEGKPLSLDEKKTYILLNKPKGYVTTLHDPQKRPIISALCADIPVRLYPVGRLDIDTEGALLLTNDGELAHKVLHPRYEVRKTYIAKVYGHPSAKKLQQLAKGIAIEGKVTAPASLRILEKKQSTTSLEIIIHEGRKRQVRKMFTAIGHHVIALKRVAYGNLKLGKLPLGKYRVLGKKDIARIFSYKNPLYNP